MITDVISFIFIVAIAFSLALYKLTEKRMDDDLTLTKVEQKTLQDMDSTADEGNSEDIMINMMKESQRFSQNLPLTTRKNDS